MDRTEHLLSIVAEEAVEVAQRATKALRFGLTEVQPGQDLTNWLRLVGEFHDLIAALEMVHGQPLTIWRDLIDAKKAKVEKYLAYSAELGTLTGAQPTPSWCEHCARGPCVGSNFAPRGAYCVAEVNAQMQARCAGDKTINPGDALGRCFDCMWAGKLACPHTATDAAGVQTVCSDQPGIRNEAVRGTARAPSRAPTLLEIKPNERATEIRDRRAGEEGHRGGATARSDELRAGGAESGARGSDAAQHEVAPQPGPRAPAVIAGVREGGNG